VPAEERLPQLGDVAPGVAARLIAEGELEVIGRLVAASNATLLCRVTLSDPRADHEAADPANGAEPGVEPRAEPGAGPTNGASTRTARGPIVGAAIYKPIRGERPLWDFPDGTLAGREMAAFLVSEASGWGIVPPTVVRDGPFGPGMVQLWMEVDESVDPVALVNDADPRLRRLAAFDAVVNNADRKVGHLLPMPDGSILGVDHGVCFHRDPKLRTVLWAWRGKKLRAAEMAVVERLEADLAGALGVELREHLTRAEVDLTRKRAQHLLRTGRFPQPSPDWPAIPWPPY
jgi:uncharacterized repeat protein (TIGR03843 family)